jgi:hypothetical protein
MPVADIWGAYENTSVKTYRLVASGAGGQPTQVFDPVIWARMEEQARHE